MIAIPVEEEIGAFRALIVWGQSQNSRTNIRVGSLSEMKMAESAMGEAPAGLSLRDAALTAGFGLFVMAICAPLATFYFLPQGVVSGDGAATLERLRNNHTPYLIGVLLLFVTYIMDVIVAWALYWFLRPG